MIGASQKVLDFFRAEFMTEEETGFARIKRIPDSYVQARLRFYQSLSPAEKDDFIDVCAHWAHRSYGWVAHARDFDHTKHPFFERWNDSFTMFRFGSHENVPIFRAIVSQYKADQRRGVPSRVTEAEFQRAQSVKSVKAPELRKRAKKALAKFGFQGTDEIGFWNCEWDDECFKVHLDFGGRSAQLRYWILLPEFADVYPQRFCFESALGMGMGDWDYIIEDNVEDAFCLLEDLVKYAVALPKRIKQAV